MTTKPNPNPHYITEALWRFWIEFDKFDVDHILTEEIEFSGIYADKPGYHNTVLRNTLKWPGNYSIRYDLDKNGVKDKSRAIDLTFKSAQSGHYEVIIKYTKLLFSAIKRKDPRLYFKGQPIIREVIGTTDGKVAKGLDVVTNIKTIRHPSHLWHIHISFFAMFVKNWEAISGILSILKGELFPTNIVNIKPKLDWMDLLVKDMLPNVKMGSTDKFHIRIWQHILNEHGYKTVVDGEFGIDTKTNTIKLQTKYGAEAKDGQVGPETWTIGLIKKDLV